MQTIKNWLDNNQHCLNIIKIKCVAFSLSSKTLPSFIKLIRHNNNCDINKQFKCDQFVERAACLKYLGVGSTIYIQIAQKWINKIMLLKNIPDPSYVIYKENYLMKSNQLFVKAKARFMMKTYWYTKDCK